MNASDLRGVFFQECEELQEALSEGLRSMEQPDHDPETVHAVFRAVHSIKGGAGAFALDALVAFAHRLETALDAVRSGDLVAGTEVMHLFHRACDHLGDLIAQARDDQPASSTQGDALLAELDALIGDMPADDGPEIVFEPMAFDFSAILPDPAPVRPWHIRFQPLPALYASGNDPALLLRALSKLGEMTVRADPGCIPALDRLDMHTPPLGWDIDLDPQATAEEIAAVFEFVEGMCGLEITSLTEAALPPVLGDPEPGPMRDTFAPPNLAESAPAPPLSIPSPAAPNDRTPDPAAGGDLSNRPQPTIRVNLDRVDRLINLVGELVIKEAMLSQSLAQLNLPGDSAVTGSLDGLKQLVSEIQEGVMATRAQPVKSMFQRMFRIVREAAGATGKQVRLDVRGDQTEVDKTVIERLVDPLTHMIRNAVDHGLELPETRLAAGKSAEGCVVLSAAHRSGRVIIEISDDGAGVNREKVREIAISKGLIAPDADMSATEIDNLLFLPGFSSKETVSNLSGRGVGLDVAKSEIQALGGRVLLASEAGKGSTFTISLPLTLAVLEGMVLDVAGETLVIPITAVLETLRPGSADIHPMGLSGRVLVNRGTLVPIIDLGVALGYRGELACLDRQILLLVQLDDGRACALVVDQIQDQRQVVIKSIETNYGHIPGIAAATILGDGRIALILDPAEVATFGGGVTATDPLAPILERSVS